MDKQLGLSGMDIISKVALNEGMSIYVFVVYRHAVATIVMAPFAIVLDKPVIGQILYFYGEKTTTATFTVSICNILPAITFVMAIILRLEVVNLKSIRSQAKVIGTITTVGGAILMTLVKGPLLTKGRTTSNDVNNGEDLSHSIKGALMVTIGIFSWSCFTILQAITLKTYPAELSLTAWICLLGTVEGAIVALVMKRGNTAVWAIKWDMTLLATLYSGIICSGLAYYIQGLIMKDRGAVFVTAFGPLSMIFVAIMGSIFLAENTYLGRVLGAIVILAGLYLVVWGKSKDEKLPTLSVEQDIAQQKQIMGKECDENNCHKVITI
ncbi:Drug/metabolite transporter [Artemisia annua]|uniref:WAT1-related protein n=1 Tax=Artemisia annua TaxID=35608 RepID=A0A2U1LFQ0_ARTAN|nr:Drug/metabolite transporter [Artemisia annua]